MSTCVLCVDVEAAVRRRAPWLALWFPTGRGVNLKKFIAIL